MVKSATCTVIDENVALSAEMFSNVPVFADTVALSIPDSVIPVRMEDRPFTSDMACECEADAYPESI